MFAEMRAAQLLGGLSNREALQLATLDGARALGLEDQIGSLVPGKWGDVIAVQHPMAGPSGGPSPETPAVLLTVVGGRVVYRA
jgi:imidazolonepropionase-like amidohydrolase